MWAWPTPSLITYYRNIFDVMFPHPCLQGVHLLVHKTREHSVCMEFRNFPILHENGKKKIGGGCWAKWPATVWKQAGNQATHKLASLRSCLIWISLSVSDCPPSLSLPLPHLHADTERMRQLPSFSAGQQSKCEINSLVPALRRSGYIHTHIRR